nr:protein spaetzle-like [Leptinotarsa decemlineata]
MKSTPTPQFYVGGSPEIDVVFPEEDESSVILPKIDGIPPCANGSTFCESFVPYPKEKVKEIMQKYNVFKEFFGVDEPPEEFETRDDSQTQFVCSSMKYTVFPVLAKNTRSEFKFIVNNKEEGYAQGVQVEICSRENKPCDVVNAPNGLITTCKQKYMKRRLLSIDDEGVPQLDTFLLPWACACSCLANFPTERG